MPFCLDPKHTEAAVVVVKGGALTNTTFSARSLPIVPSCYTTW
jgi:hypothetical protein